MERLKKSRIASFVILALIYIGSAFVGITVFRALDLEPWLSLLVADMAATVFTFLFSLIFKNASVYDPYWSVQPPVILTAFAIGRDVTLLGALLFAAVAFWAIRLTANWAYTFSGLKHQDWRYTMLSEKTGRFYPLINFIGIHAVPTLVVYGVTLPAAFVIIYGIEARPAAYVFVALAFLAPILQGVADIQMHRYRNNRIAPFIRSGLWRYSRHPNYLGEILMWWGVGIAVAISRPSMWYLLFGAVANTVLFLAVSIPMADKRQSKKTGFAEYKRQTRMLLPIPKAVRK